MENERKTRGEFKKELSSMHLQAEELEEILSIKRQPDDLFGALIAISPVAIYIVRDSKIRAVSTGFQKITGYRANELLGMYPLRIVLPDDRETVRREAIKMLKKERSSPYEFRLCTRDGKIKWILETVTSIRYQGKRAVLGNFMDITAQKEAERIKTLLYRISKTAISASSLEDFFASMHQIIRELMPAENFSVALYDPDQDTVSFPYFVDERDKRPMPRKSAKGLTEYVIRTGRPLLAHSDVFEGLVKKGEVKPLGAPFADWLGIPLKIRDGVIGAFVVQSYSEIIRYGDEERDILTFISDHMAMVVDRKQKLKKIQKAEELLQGILSSSPLGMALVEDRVIKWTNEAMAKIFGYEGADEFIGKSTRILYVSDEEYKEIGRLVYGELEKGRPFETDTKFRRRDGSAFDGHLMISSLDPSCPQKKIVGTFSDITWRKEAEAELCAERERLAVTLRSIGDGVISTDTKGRIVLINRVAERLTGWKESEAIGRPLKEVFNIINERTREPCENLVEKVLESNGIVGLANHTVLISRDGTERMLADSGAPIRDKEGNIIGVVLIFRDVTAQRKIEEELQKVEKLRSIGILAGGIAHDFNNMLMGILGNISLAKIYAGTNNKVIEKLTEAERASLRAKDLTQQLLTFSKGGVPIKNTTSIEELLRDSASFALRGSNVRCEFSLSDDLWPVEIDEGQMNQVINNLVINAQQAMPEGGIINICANNTVLEEGHGLPLRQGRYVKVAIEDQGIGISKRHLPKIFDPYFTTKQEGNGLGLAIVYSIIKNHDGYIGVKSRLEEGTEFDVYLPASKKKIVMQEAMKEAPCTGKGKILVMDDEEMVRNVAEEMLCSMGYEVESAKDGTEAIEVYRRAKESGKGFDVVVMDLTVPGGMGGKKAIKELSTIDPHVKAIVSSGYSNGPIMSNFKDYGFAGVIAKPYKMKDLVMLIHKVISE